MIKLFNLQQQLKVPKNILNEYSGFYYRSAESILEALKPLLANEKTCILIKDDLVCIGARYYVKATVTLYDLETGKEIVSTTAFAREEESKKGMDGSQITGASSSYARKYALNGMFAIDDVKDSDTTNKGDEEKKEVAPKKEGQSVCPICGKPTSQGALKNWGMCAKCKKEGKKNGEIQE